MNQLIPLLALTIGLISVLSGVIAIAISETWGDSTISSFFLKSFYYNFTLFMLIIVLTVIASVIMMWVNLYAI